MTKVKTDNMPIKEYVNNVKTSKDAETANIP